MFPRIWVIRCKNRCFWYYRQMFVKEVLDILCWCCRNRSMRNPLLIYVHREIQYLNLIRTTRHTDILLSSHSSVIFNQTNLMKLYESFTRIFFLSWHWNKILCFDYMQHVLFGKVVQPGGSIKFVTFFSKGIDPHWTIA